MTRDGVGWQRCMKLQNLSVSSVHDHGIISRSGEVRGRKFITKWEGTKEERNKDDSPFTLTFPHFILPTTTFPKIAHGT